jgi:hypothetical protein
MRKARGFLDITKLSPKKNPSKFPGFEFRVFSRELPVILQEIAEKVNVLWHNCLWFRTGAKVERGGEIRQSPPAIDFKGRKNRLQSKYFK